MKSFALFVPLVAAASAAAHGFVSQITIDGQVFKGPKPGAGGQNSVIRPVSDPNPIKGARNPAVNCGSNAKPAGRVADARPGAALTFSWNGADMSNWPHNTGPTLTYMASCGSVTCDKFDSTQAKWFKIGEEGRKGNGNWVQEDIMRGAPARAQIPANLAPGNYLIRHEIIALHLAQNTGGAEFYAACAQVKVTGNGNGRPNPSQTVSLPGDYSDTDAGIRVNAFGGGKYNFPGPAIVSLSAGGAPSTGNQGTNNNNNGGNNSNGGNNNNGDDNNEDDENTETGNEETGNEEYGNKPPAGKTESTPAPAPAATGKPKSTGTCKSKNGAKKTASPSVGAAAASTGTPGSQEGSESTYYPRSISRIFGRHRAIAQSLQHSSH